jgi:5'-methylthioadenosine phosphorylase
VASPFGEPSADILLGELRGDPVAFLPRHGPGHRVPPSEINSRANIDALKRVGVTDLLSVNAVGSLREDLAPGTLVLVDQLVDRTTQRTNSYFTEGVVAHVSLAHPVCPRMGDAVAAAARAEGAPCHRGGTLVIIEGPQFSTRAESLIHQSWGCDLVGMTALPEARLAREAELCYAILAQVTDFDCWHPGHDAVTVDEIMATMARTIGTARGIITRLPALLGERSPCPHRCDRALDAAVLTPPDARDPAVVRRLDAVAGRVLQARSER